MQDGVIMGCFLLNVCTVADRDRLRSASDSSSTLQKHNNSITRVRKLFTYGACVLGLTIIIEGIRLSSANVHKTIKQFN